MAAFFQDGPQLTNQYESDRVLREFLAASLPDDVMADVEPDLHRFGQRVVDDVAALAEQAERHEPRLVSYDAWGQRVDQIETSPAWSALDRVSAEEGIVAIGYERAHGEYSRLHQFAKMYLFNPSSAIYTCPLAMTDGAARAIEVHGDEFLKAGAYRRLTSRDPEQFWTSGQWMTERSGGSDVGQTETIARRVDGGYRLYGNKWFTSATTSQMAMTLARIEDEDGQTVGGSRGLSLFYVETRDADGGMNQIEVLRLKDKLGTRSLPTAELNLVGTPARLVGELGRGVPNIISLVNVTRLYNAVTAAANMRRGLALARDYAQRRRVFGKRLADQPLHVETLADLQIEFEAAFLLSFHAVKLMGRVECNSAGAGDEAVLRLLTPLAKLYSAKQCVASMSEILESFGGAGYVEDTGLPKLLRDSQVLSIWEGTTNVLSLDVLRAIDRDDAFGPFLEDMDRRLASVAHPALSAEVDRAGAAAGEIRQFLPRMLSEGGDAVEAAARSFAYSLARTYAATLLLGRAQESLETHDDARGLVTARRWCRRTLVPTTDAVESHRGRIAGLGHGRGAEGVGCGSIGFRADCLTVLRFSSLTRAGICHDRHSSPAWYSPTDAGTLRAGLRRPSSGACRGRAVGARDAGSRGARQLRHGPRVYVSRL